MAHYGQHDRFSSALKTTFHEADRRRSEVFSPSHFPGSARTDTISDADFGASAADANHILTNNDSQLMNTFFEDPNSFSLNLDMNSSDANVNFTSVFGYPPPPSNNQRTSSRGHGGGQNEGDDMSAASQLVNMAHAGPAHPDAANHPSWNQHRGDTNDGAMRRPSNSYYAPSMQAFNAFASQQLVQASNNVRTALSAGLVEPRHQPLGQHTAPPTNEAMNNYRYMQNMDELSFFSTIPQPNVGHDRDGRAVLPFSFGSDSNFSVSGYRGPILDIEGGMLSKRLLPLLSSNRIVPDAEQDEDTEPPQPQRLPDRAHLNHLSFPIPHSANSSPGDLGALPFASPTSDAQHNLSHFHNPLKRRNTDIEYSHTAAFGDPQDHGPMRKRHHSIIQHMTADQFMEANNSLGAAQASLNDKSQGEHANNTFGRPTGKIIQNRSDARESATPSSQVSDPASPPTSQTPPTKKKSRESKARPNLTETQKRENHIISEQKRRNVIKQAFNDLNNLIPTLQGGKSGLSKAEVLKEVVNYLTTIVDGNAHMEALLNGTDAN